MPSDPRITYHGTLVLQALAKGYRYGFDIMDFTGLPSGTAYPILRRFESKKWVRSRWEGGEAARKQGRPRRRYYELTAAGKFSLTQALERLKAQRRVFAELDATSAPSSRSR